MSQVSLRQYLLILEDLEGQKAKRAEFIRKTYGASWKGVTGASDIDDLIEKVGKADPSKNGTYMQWLAKLIIKKPDQNRVEDLARTKRDLESFEKVQAKLEKRDINAYPTFADLGDAIDAIMKRPKSDDEKEAAKVEKRLAKVKADIKTIYSGKEGWIRIPETKAAACFLGQNTKWCTAATKNNMFHSYNDEDSPLFVIYDKETKTRWQLHVRSEQFADTTDKNHGFGKTPKWAWDPIIDHMGKKKKLNFSSAAKLQKASGKDLLSGSHSDVLDLFKEFGVDL